MRFNSEAEYAEFIARYRGTKLHAANNEQPARNEPAPTDAGKKDHPRYRINVHSRCRRLTDADSRVGKWAIDGLVKGGLLPDDSPEWIESVSYSQEKAEVEETIINLILIEE